MGQMYSAVFEAISVSAVQDAFELQAPSDASVVIHRVVLTQEVTETSEQLPVVLTRGEGSVTSGSGGSTVTPGRLGAKGLPAFGGTVERNNTTRLAVGTGALVVLHREGWNVLSGFDYRPTPEERPQIAPSDFFAVGLPTAPGAALTMSGVIIFEEIGG